MTPDLSVEETLLLLKQHYGLDGELHALVSYADQNFRLTTGEGDDYVVKLVSRELAEVHAQCDAMALLAAENLPVPTVVRNNEGATLSQVRGEDGGRYSLRILSFLQGRFLGDISRSDVGNELWTDLGALLGKLDRVLADFEYPASNGLHPWDLAHGYSVCSRLLSNLDAEQAKLVEYFLEYHRLNVQPLLSQLPRSVIHNDANDHNILVDAADRPTTVTGLIDFGDMVHTHTVNELAIAAAYALMDQPDPLPTLERLVAGYHDQRALTDAEICVLYGLIGLRLCTSVCYSTAALARRPDNEYLQVSSRSAWALLATLRKQEPFVIECRLREACGLSADTGRDKQAIVDLREKHLARNLSLSFAEPLKIVRGRGAYLYDERGRDYLDMVNNVCHVGHCHPKVVAAGQAQMSRLNTNTRFLHDNIVDYAERLLATLPEPLSVCMFVNSGSEANELAFRLARTYTGSKELLVVDGAYHGNTNACIEASPYKFDGPGGNGAPDHVHKVALPDPYRGLHKGGDSAAAYAADVERALAELKEAGRDTGAYICESLQGVAGQIIMPDGYLQAVYPMVRDAGGICVADEVQVGFGRVGSHMWAFETQGVVPDIVTLGKPIANGHPMAAVVTTKEIADAFVTGMEFFSTFGGNPVSCAIGMAVLDVIEEEGLQQNALETGAYLVHELRELQNEYELIGDVRGLGLFIGVELVTDHQTLEPATKAAARIIEHLKEQRVILSTEGPGYNVLKIKPPIVFGRREADRFLTALRSALAR